MDYMIIRERLNKIRHLMKQDKVDCYLVDTADPHLSEYIDDFYKEREFLTGFTGSNGCFLLCLNEAYLWTDGRYFIQAEIELANTGIKLMKMGQKDVPTLLELLSELVVKKSIRLAFNGLCISTDLGLKLNAVLKTNNSCILDNKDYCDLIWEKRPLASSNKAYCLDMEITGESFANKLSRVRQEIQNKEADYCFMSKLDNIMWFFNIRGNDIKCNPVCYSYCLVGLDSVDLYIKTQALSPDLSAYFEQFSVLVHDYDEISQLDKIIKENSKVLINKTSLNYFLYKLIDSKFNVIEALDPTEIFKAVKNETEINNSKECYKTDSAVLTKFIKYIKENVSSAEITETKAAEILDNMRKSIPGFIELSFPTISAYGANAAMMHYEANPNNDTLLKAEGIYLVDSGASYMNGTTDVTRSIVLGPVTEEMKKYFTLTVVGMLRLQNAVFIKGATGLNLDILARMPLWNEGIDYKCGTGHGVGYILNVHEGPQSIRTKKTKNHDEIELMPGMIISDEPGVYLEDKYGIRIENILLCKEKNRSYGDLFYCFEPLTLVPIDLDGIDTTYMNDSDIEMLNDYHKRVYEELKEYFDETNLEFLKNATRKITK